MNREIKPASRAELLRDFPIESTEAPGWFFRVREVSANVWEVTGRDHYGREVSRTGHGDAPLEACEADALALGEPGPPPA